MDAEKLNAVLRGVNNFGGIFDEKQLEGVKIMSLPVMLIINSGEHWIGIYLDEKTIEIMDSIGAILCKNLNSQLCRFICAHMKGKKLVASPRLQSENSSDCGKYVVSFFIFKSLTQKSLKSFLGIFSQDYEKNSKNISKIFDTVQNLIKKF